MWNQCQNENQINTFLCPHLTQNRWHSQFLTSSVNSIKLPKMTFLPNHSFSIISRRKARLRQSSHRSMRSYLTQRPFDFNDWHFFLSSSDLMVELWYSLWLLYRFSRKFWNSGAIWPFILEFSALNKRLPMLASKVLAAAKKSYLEVLCGDLTMRSNRNPILKNDKIGMCCSSYIYCMYMLMVVHLTEDWLWCKVIS